MSDQAPLEIATGDALGALERSQIDMQISTAKKYPRSVKAFLEEAQSMIALNLETAESCNYKLKRKGKDGVKIIEGPSIRLLEIAASAYTNLRYGSRIIGIDDDFVTAQGLAFDLEKNVAQTVEVKRSIRTSTGQRYGTDMIMVTSNAAGSIARRNALNGVVPRSYIMHLSDYAKQIAVGDIKSLPERRQRAFDYFTKVLGVEVAKILAYLEKPSVDDCGLAELDVLSGLKTMLKENEITLEQAFDPKEETTMKAEVPDLGGKVTPPASTSATTPAAATPSAAAAIAPGTRKKKPAKEPEPAPPPATPAEPPAAAAAPAAPTKTHDELVLDLAKRLDDGAVELDDFFDWCKASGRGQIYKFSPDETESLTQLPPELVRDLLTKDGELAVCIKMFGKKLTRSAPAQA